MHVGVRIYTTQARGGGYSPPGIFPSTHRNPTYIACRDGRLQRITPFWCTVVWAIHNNNVGRGKRAATSSTVKRHTAVPVSHPTITPGLPRGIPPPACATCPPFATVFRPPIDNQPFVAIDSYRDSSSSTTHTHTLDFHHRSKRLGISHHLHGNKFVLHPTVGIAVEK